MFRPKGAATRRRFVRSIVAVGAVPFAGAATAQAPLGVGFVYVGPVGEAGWTYSHDVGRRAVEATFGERVKTTYVEAVSEGPDAERVIRDLVRQGNGLIFATSFGYGNAMAKVARQFPNVRFEHATGHKTADNLAVYDVRTYEGAYLAGVVAGRVSKSAQLGVVASIPIPEVIRNINAFTLGARQGNPKVRTRVVWVNKWFDPGKEREGALALIGQGCDVLMQNTDSPAVVQAAGEKGVFAFGWDSDMSRYGPKAHLGASVIQWGVYYTKVVGDVLAGRWMKGETWWGLAEGMIDLTQLSAAVPDGVRQQVARRRVEIVSGRSPIWIGPLKDQRGQLRLATERTWADKELKVMDFYLEGVDGVIPR